MPGTHQFAGVVVHRRLKLVIITTIFHFVFIFHCAAGSLQQAETQSPIKDGLPQVKEPLVRIKEIVEAVHGTTTVKPGQVLAIKLDTEKPLKTFDVLIINGFKVKVPKPDTSDFGKTVFFSVDDTVLAAVNRFHERTSLSRDTITISVALASSSDKEPGLLTTTHRVKLEVKPKISNSYIFAIICLGSLLLIGMAIRHHVLKDDNNLYYSLGRTQLFYWTVLFLLGYLYIWFRSDVLPDLTPSMLVILGISIGTTALGKAVENSAKGKTPIDPEAKSDGWFMDIMSDSSSINVQRFQNVLFNFVFGCIFLQRCYTTHALPEFDDNILLLMGISSSTYAGLKVTEPIKEQKQALPQSIGGPPEDQKNLDVAVG